MGAGERRADHHRVGADRDRLREIATCAHPAVGDHIAVLAGLEHVLRTGGGDIGDRGCLRHAEAENAAGRAGGTGSDADEHADSAGAHQVQAGRIGGAAAGDDRDPDLLDELLQVQRLRLGRDVLCRDHGALDDQDVEAGLERDLVVLGNPLRGQ